MPGGYAFDQFPSQDTPNPDDPFGQSNFDVLFPGTQGGGFPLFGSSSGGGAATNTGTSSGFGGAANSPWASVGDYAGYGTGSGLAGGGGASGGFWGNLASNYGQYGSAIAGGVGSYLDAQAAQRAAEQGSNSSGSSQSNPWGPSVPNRQFILDEANRLYGQGPTYLGGGGGGGRGGGGGGGGIPSNFFSSSPESQQLLQALMGQAMGGSPLYGSSDQFVQGLLSGGETNPYRGQLQSDLQGYQDPNLSSALGSLFGGALPGLGAPIDYQQGGNSQIGQYGGQSAFGAGGGRGGGGGNFSVSAGSGGGVGPVGTARDVRGILDGRFLEEGNPYLDALVSRTTDDLNEAFMNTVIPGINAQFEGAGMFGSSPYSLALGEAEGQRADSLGDVVAEMRAGDWNARMADYMNALGIGAGLDTAAQNRQASMASAGASANAQRYSADRNYAGLLEQLASGERRQQMGDSASERQAMLSALMGGIGMGQGMDQFRLDQLGGLSNSFSADQMGALGMVPGLSGLPMRDLSGAFGAAFDVDQAGAQYGMGAAQLAEQRRNSNAGRNFQRQMYNANAPWDNLSRYADLTNASSSGYGTNVNQQQSQQPYLGSSPWAALLGGALGAYGTYQQFR